MLRQARGGERRSRLSSVKCLRSAARCRPYGPESGPHRDIGADIKTFTYDGDTPQDARKAIRARGHIVVTNPDMRHSGMLAQGVVKLRAGSGGAFFGAGGRRLCSRGNGAWESDR